jgi:hypothetical protein
MLTKCSILAALACVIFFTLGGYGQEAERDAAKPERQPTCLSGRGDRASKKFALKQGLVIWKITHTGESNFQIRLLDEGGNEVNFPLNRIGRYDGSQAGHIRRSGNYRLQVTADGDWSVSIDQPRPETAPDSPISLSGKAPQGTEFFTLSKGLHVFETSHKGSGIFRVQLLNASGQRIEQITGVVGNYDGSRAIKIEQTGIYLMNIVADGDWSVSVD